MNCRCWTLLITGFLSSSGNSHTQAATLLNADFEADGGRFAIPTGWTPYGEAGFGSTWDQDWKAYLADVHPRHHAGLYQVIPDTVPGQRYQLEAQCRSGHEHLVVRIGLLAGLPAGPDEIVWSQGTTQAEWRQATVEVVAESNAMLAFLDIENRNAEHQLLQGGSWDKIRLVEHGGTPLSPRAAPTLADVGSPPPPADVYANLANLWSLAWPKPGVKTMLAGTHHPDPKSNADFDRFEDAVVESGQEWNVLKSLTGPGAIVRIWMTNFDRKDRIRIEVDGRIVFEDRLVTYFGQSPPFAWPLANKTSGAWVSHVPIPFADSARVLVTKSGKGRFYWQVTHQAYDSREGLRAFSVPLNQKDAAYLDQIRMQWTAATLDPKPRLAGTQESSGAVSVEGGGIARLWLDEGAGMVAAVYVEPTISDAKTLAALRIRATWDHAEVPQVDAPLGLFFGVGYHRNISRGLLAGMSPPFGGYCYFPMPYQSAARIELVNTGTQNVPDIRFRVKHVPLCRDQISPLRFHAFATSDSRAGERCLFMPLDVTGQGHFVGLSAAMAHGSSKDSNHLEGDEYFWIDGESVPSTAGTGTEDYFSCGWYFFGGPITLAPVGAPEVCHQPLFRVSAYRFHVPDWLPFQESLKLGLEVGDRISSDRWGVYSTVAYYYLNAKQ